MTADQEHPTTPTRRGFQWPWKKDPERPRSGDSQSRHDMVEQFPRKRLRLLRSGYKLPQASLRVLDAVGIVNTSRGLVIALIPKVPVLTFEGFHQAPGEEGKEVGRLRHCTGNPQVTCLKFRNQRRGMRGPRKKRRGDGLLRSLWPATLRPSPGFLYLVEKQM